MRRRRWTVWNNVACAGVELFCFEQVGDSLYCMQAELSHGNAIDHNNLSRPDPTLFLSPEEAQTLAQALWDQGFRPNNGSGSTAEAEAMKGHIRFAERVADKLLSRDKQ